MCKILEVSRSCFYEFIKQRNSQRAIANESLKLKIKDIFIESHCTYGSRRIKKSLQAQGIKIGYRRTTKLMKQLNLYCKTKRKFRITTDSKHNLPIAINVLQRNFTATQPNEKYVGDITYVWTEQGWLYLAVVIDLFSRRVVGWAMDDNMKARLVNEALLMAIWTRKPQKGLTWHTDRGSQYASESHRDILAKYDIVQSMSRSANCWDNSVAESFFHTFKTELTHHLKFTTKEEAKKAIFEYIEVFYNRKRLHSTVGYMTPVEFENKAVNL